MNGLLDGLCRSALKPVGSMGRMFAKISAGLGGQGNMSRPSLRHLETLSLGMKQRIVLFECDGARFLLAMSDNLISAPVPLAPRFAVGHDGERE